MANTKILLLSVDSLKENSTIDYNVEDKILESSILDASNIDIQGILGSTLYVEILSKVENSTMGASDVETVAIKALLDDFIVPALLKFSLFRCVMPMRVSFRNKGLVENNSENSQPVDKEFINYVENKISNDSEFYANKLKARLCTFFTAYPAFSITSTAENSEYNSPNRKNAYFSGLQLKNR